MTHGLHFVVQVGLNYVPYSLTDIQISFDAAIVRLDLIFTNKLSRKFKVLAHKAL